VPRVTIDMGDGRKLQGTITGNSIHYVLDSRGRVVDALPGLYAPRVFRDLLSGAGPAAREFGRLDDAAFTERVAAYHRDLLRAFDGAVAEQALAVAGTMPTATEAALLARSKALLERPLVEAVSSGRVDTVLPERVASLAARYAEDSRLGDASRDLLLRKHEARAREYGTPSAHPDLVVARFERTLAEDTAYNEYVLHRRLRGWFAEAPAPLSLDALNVSVYAELFLTPATDPWLGLFAPDTYAGLEPVR
jgi:hypothetical protein